jgi:glycosyltransferase involved in cell wall biosynthesis
VSPLLILAKSNYSQQVAQPAPTPTAAKPAATSAHLAFNLSTGADTGGAAIREIEAFRSPAGLASKWEVRAMVAASNYIGYTQDVPYSLAGIERLYDAANVVHLNHTLHGYLWYDKERHRPLVLEHHGLHRGAFNIDFKGVIRQCNELGITQIGSTANLELFGPITWTPIPYDLDQLALIRKQVQAKLRGPGARTLPKDYDPDVLTIAHAPTNREIKSTAAFISAMNLLTEIGLPVRMLLIENKTHAECLRLKAQADIFVDQLTLGYGCNAIEAWGMGIPVVGGITDPAWRKHMAKRWSSPPPSSTLPPSVSPQTAEAIKDAFPFLDATESTLVKALTTLISRPGLREEYAERGLTHVRRWHSQAGHVKQMVEIYEAAPEPRIINRPPLHLTHKERLALLRSNRAETIRRVKLGL